MADTTSAELLVKLRAIDELTPIMAKAVSVMETQTNAIVESLERMQPASKKAEDGAQGLNTGLINLASTVNLAKAAYEGLHAVWGAIEGTVSKAIEQAEEAEQAQNKLTGALVAQGKYTEANTKKIADYAKAMQTAKGVSEDQTKTLVAQGVQMGLSIEKALQMEEAARKLAVATGQDANTAFTMLSASINGQVRGLQKVIPEVKELTAAQLKSGAAADLVNKYLTTQYELYSGGFSASVKKAKTSVDQVYEALGKMITQNPIVLKGIKSFTGFVSELAENLDKLATWLQGNGPLIERFGNAVGQALKVGAAGLAIWGVAALAATPATTALAAAAAILFSPITLAIGAVTLLTAAFMKWPGLFDQIVGGIKIFAGLFVEGMAKILDVAAKVAGVFDKDLAKSINKARDSMMVYAEGIKTAGGAQMVLGEQLNQTNEIVIKSVAEIEKENEALNKNQIETSKTVAAKKLLADSYAGILVGTEASRLAMESEAQQRDKDLKKYTEYLDLKKRLAVSKQQEQQLELAKTQANAVGGTGGEESSKANANLAVQTEQQKQAQLQALKKAGVINQKQLDEEVFESGQRIRQQELIAETAHQQALADILGTGPAGFEAQREIRRQKYEAEVADQVAAAQRLGATQQQIDQLKAQRLSEFRNKEIESQRAHDEQLIGLATETNRRKAEALGNTPEALALRQQMEEQQFQMDLQNKILRAQQENATQAEIDAMKEQQELEHLARRREAEVQFYENQAQLQEKAGNDWEAFLARRNAAVASQGVIMGNISAVQNSQYFKATNQALTDLSSLRTSKDKKQFELGKAAAIAQATVQTFLGATQAFTSLSSIPIVGPVLGAVAAAAAIASGMNQISQIKSQQFNGGQADAGMDSIPQALSGKSFVLSQGERVVQPSANKELTSFLEKEKMASQQGGSRGAGNTYNITVNAGGLVSTGETRKVAEVIVKEIRAMSEKGTPIISSKGVIG